MNISYGLRLEQTQKLIMTPELRQAIKILQFSALELTDFINQMILDNPMIEASEEENYTQRPDRKEKETDFDWEDYVSEMRDFPEKGIPQDVRPELAFENMVSENMTLHDYIYSQLGLIKLSARQREIGDYLVGSIDGSGYLVVTMEQAKYDMGASDEEIEQVLEAIQNCDPPGIGARNLKECLLIQVRRKGLTEEGLVYMIENHLENLAAGKLCRIAQDMGGVTIARVQELADIIKKLNPKPGASFGGGDKTKYIVPDIIVEKVDNEYVIILNDHNIPKLTINKTYYSILREKDKNDSATRDFVERKLNQAVWLIRSIEQRRMTLYHVTEALIKLQKGFFERGIRYLKPLTLKQIAEMINVHESTVSRATSNKYIQTPHGIFGFKFFFDSGITTLQGDTASSESIKLLIQEIIKGEDATRPCSDQKIADILAQRGIAIARRTVSKYREEMRIPSTGFRKRYSE